MEPTASIDTLPMEGRTLPDHWTFEAVEDRLVEALMTCWRHPDRERGWQRLRSAWPDVLREVSAGDYDARGGDHSSSDVVIRPAAMTRRDTAEMEEAFGWVDRLDAGDRKLVGIVIAQLARGQREVRWRHLLRPMGLKRGADGLRMRYSRAIASIAEALNGGNPRCFVSTRKIDMR